MADRVETSDSDEEILFVSEVMGRDPRVKAEEPPSEATSCTHDSHEIPHATPSRTPPRFKGEGSLAKAAALEGGREELPNGDVALIPFGGGLVWAHPPSSPSDASQSASPSKRARTSGTLQGQAEEDVKPGMRGAPRGLFLMIVDEVERLRQKVEERKATHKQIVLEHRHALFRMEQRIAKFMQRAKQEKEELNRSHQEKDAELQQAIQTLNDQIAEKRAYYRYLRLKDPRTSDANLSQEAIVISDGESDGIVDQDDAFGGSPGPS